MNEGQRQAMGFGTFSGVFRPVTLTILGAMLYLREGWLVGNNGLLGAILVIVAAYVITGATSLSLSTIASNVRVARGGPFAIVSRALGLEAGGAIGVPLYVAQAVSSVMYLYAFSEAWAHLFPSHDGRLVALLGFAIVGGIALISAHLAARAQAVMLGMVAVALLSALVGLPSAELQSPVLIGRFPEVGLLGSFAIFFPAATGIMVGAGMSGELADPRQSLPRGTLGAWTTTGVLYLVFAVWYALVASPAELLANKTVMVDRAGIGFLVLVGVLSSTLMAALSSLVAAPRLLQAMAEYKIVPGSDWLVQLTPTGQPRNAVLATLGLASIGLSAGSLDAIAPIITSCFLLTYLALNAVVFLEQRLSMVSFRPTWPVAPWVPALGLAGCVLALAVSSPTGGLLEVIAVIALYTWLTHKRLETPWETVHSGLAMTLAARLALWAVRLSQSARSWKPDLLVPVADVPTLQLVAPLVAAVIEDHGSVKYAAMVEDPLLERHLDTEVERLRGQGSYSSWHPMPTDDPTHGITLTMNAMRGTFFAANLMLLTDRKSVADLQSLRDHGQSSGIGTAVMIPGQEGGPVDIRVVNVWLSDRSPDWDLGLQLVNTDLPVLLAWLLTRRESGQIRLFTAVRDPAEVDRARVFLDALIDQGRLPAHTQATVSTQPFLEAVGSAPPADLHLLGLPATVDVRRLREICGAAGGPCLFLQDSGQESLLA